ncbi:VOC family protein [Clostridium tagluense]|uniref:VOC family protein n=1 Tax=Clostridium tagluense TaxID=360422 RepID=UPI001CF4D424|nr:VOC family protein [Clostridium tagluense]MCB2314020.1 VOC family protein [Clostridium tagluense]MCB2318857.1 VOC family protein [Clostridium tagluense]MCB2323692.1 VOC family protein [Clostridium tagluense]MCB2328578.1 VOC family protein [Clostridium tagluense]MCB2333434.1 VOC family protein [Clostridium tagluense]
MNVKMLHHVCIQTEKYEESLKFYTEILEFELVKTGINFHKRDFNTWLRLGTFMIELQTAKKGDKLKDWSSLNEGIVHMCFLVDSVQVEFERIEKLGYANFKIKNGEKIYKVGDGYLFKIKAPEGTEIEIRDMII